ncbi:MAG: hypothetical protein KC776_14620 [Myxococcales bacterium]|nr:hypothetical protein [Myxococcales bacterium]MCB9579870.1 hypothetical protein [Polyangiaceae bacterium]
MDLEYDHVAKEIRILRFAETAEHVDDSELGHQELVTLRFQVGLVQRNAPLVAAKHSLELGECRQQPLDVGGTPLV